MHIIFLSFLCALGYLIILCKMLGIPFVTRTQVLWDVVFTVGMPILFLGTFNGMATAFIAGIIFSGMTAFLSSLQTKKPMARRGLPHTLKQS